MNFEGESFKTENPFDAVLGAVAALKTLKKIGDTFQAVHGTSEGGREHKQTFKVVGILAPPARRRIAPSSSTCKASTTSTTARRWKSTARTPP